MHQQEVIQRLWVELVHLLYTAHCSVMSLQASEGERSLLLSVYIFLWTCVYMTSLRETRLLLSVAIHTDRSDKPQSEAFLKHTLRFRLTAATARHADV